MIIVCPECSTKFNISQEKLPEGKAKVRCARCKHIFTIENASANTEFNYEQFQELDNQDDKSNFNFGNDLNSQDKALLSEEQNFSTTEDETASTSGKEGLNSAAASKKGGALTILIKILLLIILILLIAAGVYIFQNGTDALNSKVQQLLGQQIEQPVRTGEIILDKLEGKFVQNEQVGELFLIRGAAINKFKEPRAGLQVKGVIFDHNGKPLLQKTVFCGNPIKDTELTSLAFSKLEEMMGNQFGEELSNMKVAPEQKIPFDIVFKDLPANLSEYSVKVTASKSASE